MTLFRLLADFDGRIDRTRFWLGGAIVALAVVAIRQAAPFLFGDWADAATAFAGAFALFPWAALAAKRAADRGGSSLFGVLLVCAIVLPDQLRLVLSAAWAPSLQTIALIAWVVALVDLGLMPGAPAPQPAAAPPGAAGAARWLMQRPSSPATRRTRPP